MCPYTPTAGRAASVLQWLARPCGVIHSGQSTCMPALKLPTIENPNCAYDHESRGESGWCSDITSTGGVWRHTGVRFLLSGAAAVLTSVLQRPQLPRPSVGRSLIGPLLAVWRQTWVRFLLSGAAALQTSVLQQLQLPRPSVGRSLIGLLLAVWRHTRVRFLACLAAAMLTSVPQRLQPARPSVGRLLTRSFFLS